MKYPIILKVNLRIQLGFNSRLSYLLLLTFTLFLTSKLVAQKSIGVKANIGAGIIKKDYIDEPTWYNHTSLKQPSGQVGFYYQIEPKKWKSFFVTEILLN